MTAQTLPDTETALYAGSLGCVFDGAQVHHLSWGGVPVLRMVLCAVRDPAWGTVIPRISGLEIRCTDASFHLSYDADYQQDDIRLRAGFRFEAWADGSFEVGFSGQADADFDFARIGLCLLLPWESYAGRDYMAALHGVRSSGVIPPEIAKQLFVDECYVPSVPPFTWFRVAPNPRLTLELAFEGDEFEMEDQRNWTDSTLKIYSTPLHLGNLHHARTGQRIAQKITGRIRAAQGQEPANSAPRPVALTAGGETGFVLPPLGTSWPSAGADSPGAAAIPRLSHLRLDVDLKAAVPSIPEGLALPAGAGIELAVLTDIAGLARLAPLARQLATIAPLHRVIVNDSGADNTAPDLILTAGRLLREAGFAVPVGGGSDFWFAEINRVSHDYRGLDFLSFSVTPQLHVFDDASVFEAAGIQGQVIAAARDRVANGQVVISPVTLIPRDPGAARQGLAQAADSRHDSDFLTAWTAAALSSALAAGPAALTLFDLFGPHGLMRPDGAGLAPLPAFRLLSTLASRAGQRLTGIESTDPVAVRGFGVAGPEGRLTVLANCCRAETPVLVHGFAGQKITITSLLCNISSHGASRSDIGQRDSTAAEDALGLTLAPHEVLCIETGGPQT